MKKEKIEKMLREGIRDTTPDVLAAIDLETIEIKKPEKQSPFSRWKRPVFIGSLATASLALVVLFVMFLLPFEDPFTPPGNGNGVPIAFDEKEEVYTLSAFSAVSLLDRMEEGNLRHAPSFALLSSPGPSMAFTGQNAGYLIDRELDTLTQYLAVIEPIISGKDAMQFTLSESPREEYTYMMVFQSKNLRGMIIEETIHYNRIETGDDEYRLEGIMEKGATTYSVIAELEIEEDGFELELYAHHPSEEDTYIKVEQEIEEDSQTFEYEYVVRGDTVFESTLEIDFDDEEIEIELTYETATKEVEFEIIRFQEESAFRLHIEYEIDTGDFDEEGVIIVSIIYDAEEGIHKYRFAITIEDETSFARTRPYPDS